MILNLASFGLLSLFDGLFGIQFEVGVWELVQTCSEGICSALFDVCMGSSVSVQIVYFLQLLAILQSILLYHINKVIKLQTLTHKQKMQMRPTISQNHHQQLPKRPESPKFGSSYGLKSPPIPSSITSRQVLLDKIINNCQRAQSPVGSRRFPLSKFKRSYHCPKNQGDDVARTRDCQKQNVRTQGSCSREKQRNKNSLEKRQSYTTKQQYQDNGKKISIGSSSIYNLNKPSSMHCNPSLQHLPAQQYFQPRLSPCKQISSPTYKFKTQSTFLISNSDRDFPKIRRPDSIGSQKNESIRVQQNRCAEDVAVELRQKIEEEKARYIEHCRKEERKMRLYYVQLENKLCEMRNKQLGILAEYESQKLRQLDQCMKLLQKHNAQQNIEQCRQKLKQVHKKAELKTCEQLRPEIKGCLVSDVNGILFSFDQKIVGEAFRI